jgi:Uncharacterized protein conserved in bacteria
MLEGAILSLYLFTHPVLSFSLATSVNMVEEMINTNNTSKVAEMVREYEKNEKRLHIEQVTLINKRKYTNSTVIVDMLKNNEWLKFEISAYTNGYESTRKCKGDRNYGRTASGLITKEGRTVSADPNLLPIGTIIFIDGIGERRVEDTGSAIKGYKLDLFIEDLQEAKKFGRKKGVKVKIIKMGKGKIE